MNFMKRIKLKIMEYGQTAHNRTQTFGLIYAAPAVAGLAYSQNVMRDLFDYGIKYACMGI